MKILITGATGFIGKNLCQELLGKGHKIFALTRKPLKKGLMKKYTILNGM